jgi:hypothetical protein
VDPGLQAHLQRGESANEQPLREASGLLMTIASLEEEAMALLFENTSGFMERA